MGNNNFRKTLITLFFIVFATETVAVVRTMPVPEGYPVMENQRRPFSVSVNGYSVALYNDVNYWGGTVDFGSFEMTDGEKVIISVVVDEAIKTMEILPRNEKFNVTQKDSHNIEIQTVFAGEQITIVVNGDPMHGCVLHLFCNKYDNTPQPSGYNYDSASSTHSFGAGYYNLRNITGTSEMRITGKQSIYLAPGAVVYGTLVMDDCDGARIWGGGMIVNAERGLIKVLNTKNSSIEDVMVHGHCWHAWQVTADHCTDISFKRLKIINMHYASTDGLDLVFTSHSTIDSCFVRACDDAVAIKALGNAKPAENPACEDLTFRHLQLWNDCNNAFGIGAETRAQAFRNIKVEDIDILFSYDDPQYHTILDERAALNICSLHGTWFHDILFDNIRIYHCQRLIGLGFKPSFWFGSIIGDQTGEGGIYDIIFRNIQSFANSGNNISNKIMIYDWHQEGKPDKTINNLVFDNINICGKKLKKVSKQYFDIRNNCKNKIQMYFK